jgi:hypothetical protein
MATPASAPHFDLNNMLKLQQNYAVDLTKIPIDAATNNSNNNAISNLNVGLNNLYNNVSSSQAASQSVLFKQKIVNDILDTESSRLNAKKANIDTAMSGQRRMIALNNNYQKRYAAYTKMMIAIVIGIVAYFFINSLMVLLPMIPQFVFYIILIILLGFIAIYVYLLYLDIARRDLMNFDEVRLASPDVTNTDAITANGTGISPSAGGVGKGSSANYAGCMGSDCCGVDQNGKPIPYSDLTGCAIQTTVA